MERLIVQKVFVNLAGVVCAHGLNKLYFRNTLGEFHLSYLTRFFTNCSQALDIIAEVSAAGSYSIIETPFTIA